MNKSFAVTQTETFNPWQIVLQIEDDSAERWVSALSWHVWELIRMERARQRVSFAHGNNKFNFDTHTITI